MQFQRLGATARNWLERDHAFRAQIASRYAHRAAQAELDLTRSFHPEEHPDTLPPSRVITQAADAREAFRAAHIAHMTALQELAEAEEAL